MPGAKPISAGEIDRRLPPAGVELVDRRKVVGRQAVDVLARGDERVEDGLLEVAPLVVLRDSFFDPVCHAASPEIAAFPRCMRAAEPRPEKVHEM